MGFLHQPSTSLPPALPARRGGEERGGGSGAGSPGPFLALGATPGTGIVPAGSHRSTSGSRTPREEAAPQGSGWGIWVAPSLGSTLPVIFASRSAFNYPPNKSGLQENGSFVARELICSRCSFPALNPNPQLGTLQLATAEPGTVSRRIRAPFGGGRGQAWPLQLDDPTRDGLSPPSAPPK